MRVKVVECGPALAREGVSALVIAYSKARYDGEPAVRVLMRLRMREGATKRQAYELALRYLDVA